MRSGLLLVAALAVTPLSAAPASVKEFHKLVPIAEAGRLSLTSHNGSVSVVAWNRPEVGIDARIEAARDGYAEDVQKTEIRVDGGGGNIDVESDFSRVTAHTILFGFGISRVVPLVDYTIHMPATARLRVSVHNASVNVSGLTNGADVETHNGKVELASVAGEVAVETHNGDINIDFARFSAPARIETHNGAAAVRLPADARVSLISDTHRRDPVTSDLPLVVRSSGDRWNATVNGGGPELHFTAHNGSLRVTRR